MWPIDIFMKLETYHDTVTIDEHEFHSIFTKYYVSLCLFAKQFIADNTASEDIVAETFVKLWQIRKEFSYHHQVKAFLYTMVRNKALNELEHLKVVEQYSKQLADKQTEEYFHDAIIEEESYRILFDAIDKLPEQMKKIIRLTLDGKKNIEIAKELNVSIETVHTLKKIAYKKLRENLKDYFYLLFI